MGVHAVSEIRISANGGVLAADVALHQKDFFTLSGLWLHDPTFLWYWSLDLSHHQWHLCCALLCVGMCALSVFTATVGVGGITL